MADTPDWDARERAALAALPSLDFLLGVWQGAGQAHGTPLTGRFAARRILAGTVVESREVLYSAAGEIDHEDMALYRHEPDRGLFVQHLQPPGWSSEHDVVSLDRGIAWDAGPVEPRVEIVRGDGILTISVWFPYQPVPMAKMIYRKVEA